ncbi:putative AAA family ATPase [Sclerotinia borealis F-4128]|uniref:Putative AAA family ATPase n=1 Tax=Sclerotinia borealis (strain F-4128) TaxID=1432307 RepID=W9CAE5_SCLBF|nr:putative AAA family ATPase [Sclerotinia borealis F-4128]
MDAMTNSKADMKCDIKSLYQKKMLMVDALGQTSILMYRHSKSFAQAGFEQVFKDYPGVTPSLKRLNSQAPFNAFVHRWTQLMQAIEDEGDGETKTHLVLLYKIIESELKDIIATDKSAREKITDDEVSKFADANINGRQIKNVLKTAKLLASQKNELLKFEHVQTVMSVEGN